MKTLGRAIGHLGNYRKITAIAYLALFASTAAQLAVPQVVQNIVTMYQNVLLGSRKDMDDILEAMRKVQAHGAELAKA